MNEVKVMVKRKCVRVMVAEIALEVGQWRVDSSPGFFDRMSELQSLYPNADIEGGVHEGYKFYINEWRTEQ